MRKTTLFVVGALLLSWPLPAAGAELLVFDWNKPVPKSQRGFPWDQPPMSGVNGDWTTPHDFANGTVYHRVQIRSQPVAQDMNLQFCFWQKVPDRETCGEHKAIKGTAGSVVTWSNQLASWWKKNNLPVDWTQPRDRNGVAIKDTSFKCVSDYSGWNWNGHDPADWYPLDLRFTVVVVTKGSTFSGWAKYIGNPAKVTTTAASSITTTAASLNGEVTDTGGSDPTVTIYWGSTDGQTDATTWEHAEKLGIQPKGSFSKQVSGLTPGQTYHFRTHASNAAGATWAAASQSFATVQQPGDHGGASADQGPSNGDGPLQQADSGADAKKELSGSCNIGGAGSSSTLPLLLLLLVALRRCRARAR
jgi:hypothetical protein